MDPVKQITKAIESEAKKAMRKTMRELHKESLRISDGPKRPKGYYAMRNNPTGVAAPLIARRTGALRASWKVQSRGLEGTESNQSRVIDFIDGGTRKMVRRPITAWLERFGRKTLEKNLKDNLS